MTNPLEQVLEALRAARLHINGEALPTKAGALEIIDAAITTLRAHIEAEKGWRPIESAPRGSGEDGPSQVTHPDYVDPPKLLLATSDGIVVGYYEWYYHPGYGRGADPSESIWRDHDGGRLYDVTHWMPLPPPPIEPREEKL